MKCARCNHSHDGSPMRTDPRYNRIRGLLLEFPMTEDGKFTVCHHCQRWICWHGGIVNYLAGQVLRLAGSKVHWTAHRVTGVKW